MVRAYETNIAFSSTIQSQKPYNSIIINCYASTDSVFSKVISEKEIAVFGEFRVLVFYRQPNASKESDYKSFTLRKNFCEIVLFDALEKNEIKTELILQPSCSFNYISKSRLRSFWNIEVSGEIRVSSVACEPENDINSLNTASINNSTDFINASNSINTIETANSANVIGTVNLVELVNTIKSNSSNITAINTSTALADENCIAPVNATQTTDVSEPRDATETIDDTNTVSEDIATNSQEKFEYNISSKVWQFEDSDSTRVEELMYMDFESLRKVDKD